MSIKEFFTNWIVRNVLLAVVLIGVVVAVASLALNLSTKHGEEITVPDFTNLSRSEAVALARSVGVRLVLADSVYVKRMSPGAVYMQTPVAGSSVKLGRRIRIVTNTLVPKEVYMPSLVGCSLRQAKAELMRNSLVLGRLIYVRDIATNVVIRQQYGSREIAPGAPLVSGSKVNLVLGLSSTDNMSVVPNFVGVKYPQLTDMVQDNSLNVGRLAFDSSVKTYADTLAARVYSQRPEYESEPVLKGSDVTLYLTVDEKKISKATSK